MGREGGCLHQLRFSVFREDDALPSQAPNYDPSSAPPPTTHAILPAPNRCTAMEEDDGPPGDSLRGPSDYAAPSLSPVAAGTPQLTAPGASQEHSSSSPATITDPGSVLRKRGSPTQPQTRGSADTTLLNPEAASPNHAQPPSRRLPGLSTSSPPVIGPLSLTTANPIQTCVTSAPGKYLPHPPTSAAAAAPTTAQVETTSLSPCYSPSSSSSAPPSSLTTGRGTPSKNITTYGGLKGKKITTGSPLAILGGRVDKPEGCPLPTAVCKEEEGKQDDEEGREVESKRKGSHDAYMDTDPNSLTATATTAPAPAPAAPAASARHVKTSPFAGLANQG